MKSIHRNFVELYHIVQSAGGINIRKKLLKLDRGDIRLITTLRVRNQLELYFVNNNWITCRKYMISNN